MGIELDWDSFPKPSRYPMQFDALVDTLKVKIVHSVFYRQCQVEGVSALVSHAWLLDCRLLVWTKGLHGDGHVGDLYS